MYWAKFNTKGQDRHLTSRNVPRQCQHASMILEPHHKVGKKRKQESGRHVPYTTGQFTSPKFFFYLSLQFILSVHLQEMLFCDNVYLI